MKTERRPVYIARDKSEHQTEAACAEHERLLDRKLVGDADETEITRALAGGSPEVLAALERVGNEARAYRRANGGSRRKAKREAPHLRDERRAATTP